VTPTVELKTVTKTFGDVTAVDSLSIAVHEGEFYSLLGPSGCGKTTTLRLIAGFEEPTEGSVHIKGDDVTGKRPYQRSVNTVFQNYALFPHLTVSGNIAFGLERKRLDRPAIRERITEALALVRLEGHESRYPRQLSGGQQQRVALARALVLHPDVLLLDEPLGALDLKLRKQMQLELKHLQEKVGITFIYVTHDQEEALTMSDRIAVMEDGRLIQTGTPEEIYNHPATRFVAGFIGVTNLFHAAAGSACHDGLSAETDGGLTVALPADPGIYPGKRLSFSIRPEKIAVSFTEPPSAGKNRFPGKIADRVFLGSSISYRVAAESGEEITANQASDALSTGPDRFTAGDRVWVSWRPEDCVVLAE